MFADTHCHFFTMQERGIELASFFSSFVGGAADKAAAADKASGSDKEGAPVFPFMLDAGTCAGDLPKRLTLKEIAEAACGTSAFLHFSAGVWPDDDAVLNRFTHIEELTRCIQAASRDVCAIGECGLDRNHNGAEKGGAYLKAEEELFALQLELAQKLSLPVIVHSRDDFARTFGVMSECGCTNAVIHCFSYGMNEARAFLDAGYYISFSGSITFGKREAAEQNRALVRYVPRERLLLETDAPYLTPVPHRGKVNTPLFIEHTYRFVAESLGMDSQNLACIIEENAQKVFAPRVG